MSQDIEKILTESLQDAQSLPFLFIGSGFSRRYLGLEDWEGLLRRFCANINYFEYYFSEADGHLPSVAQLMARDYASFWWEDQSLENERSDYSLHMKTPYSALKCSISKYLKDLSNSEIPNEQYEEEKKLLSEINVDGIITTNWDLILETFFPDYKVYIGQDELLFSTQQSIAEIYKIHGCCSDPNSIVLTNEDYEDFRIKNTYLAAKLLTIFVEHPVIFIGSSMSDQNVIDIVKSLSQCLKPESILKIQDNLIFVQRMKDGRIEGVSNSILRFEDVTLPVKLVTASSYVPVYKALNTVKRKIPVKVLRTCKEQLYTLIKENDPKGVLRVSVDYDSIEKRDDIEFVIGVGIVSEISEKGYGPIINQELFEFYIKDEDDFDSSSILRITIPNLCKHTEYLPFFKYLHDVGINSAEEYEDSEFKLPLKLFKDVSNYNPPTAYRKQYENLAINMNFSKIVDRFASFKVCYFVPLMNPSSIEMDELFLFLKNNLDMLYGNYSSIYKKLVCYYDYLMYGWEYEF